MILTVDGQKYEITNWDEFQKKFLSAIGFQLQSEIRKQVDRMNLIGSTRQLRLGTDFIVQGNELTMTSSAPHAVYIEYGTYDYWEQYGQSSFPDPGYPTIPKKKELKPSQRRGMPKGMQPFAPFRRVLWNQKKMDQIINKAVKNVTL
jgi:hypothetical protein